MNANMLSTLGAGFTDAALGSQAVFRSALQALSHPGRIVELSHDAQAPSQGHGASAALLLALLDPDCRLWLSPSLAGSDAAAWLRFHTGCVLVEEPAQAQFAWIGQGDACPPLDAFAQGSDAYPDQSATCVIDVMEVSAPAEGNQPCWTLRGPGIQDRTVLAVEGLAPAFAAQWSANHALFPRGVDVFLAAPRRIAGLPRTTRIEQEA
ncbi:alpha-D-ribose 1-methylphosphonate 5-triphosphate synthase subunit PhnH [Variovorax beijingensis]|uniref:Alpha-D-ribose 1-methylphosphonate 5-triphosphate synthase subunit PhnH n=1 Tax=Variovorax beijingensis TaxID=2496117 RepID=A0A561BBE8_9BURK|nr:phosphonate C-P lyase system protein PhnH [Variovorax beijingensis]TWD76213.1 alpha-D-ribose 1-methylphosphonate 5-triphosphate synthase subunit PhnH [Variovorax beijingensis]